jgi:hypothetical protein
MFSSLFLLLAGASTADVCIAEFPLRAAPARSSFGDMDLAFERAAHQRLSELENVVFVAVPLPDGTQVEIAAERITYDASDMQLVVDGKPTRWVAPAESSSWKGRVVGEEASEVFLSFSPLGSRGWIRHAGETYHLLAGPGAGADWSHASSKLVSETSLLARGYHAELLCPVDGSWNPASGFGAAPYVAPSSTGTGTGSGAQQLVGTHPILECRLAIETDFQLYQRFGNLAAMQNYLTQLFTAASDRYDTDLTVVLDVVYLGVHTTSNDGWVSGDNGAGAGAMLDEFRIAWTGNIPNGAHLAHFLSGAGLGGGVAYLATLCDQAYGFAVSGDLSGNTPFPVQQGPLTWDFMVFTHELGHNFGTPHTHDYCPPFDQCSPLFGQCQTSQVCISNGTLMSYCHLCSGGMNNMALFFHPVCAQVMRGYADNSCIPTLCTLPHNYCPLSPNSYDPFGASLTWYGSQQIADNTFQLTTTGVPPGTSGLYYYGQNQTFQTFGNGYRCIGNPSFRLPIIQANPFGEIDLQLDFTQLPSGGTISAGQTWNFQLWFRNIAGGGAGFNLSDGLSVQFCP